MVERRSIIHTHSKTIRLTNDELTLFVVALLNELAALLGRDELGVYVSYVARAAIKNESGADRSSLRTDRTSRTDG